MANRCKAALLSIGVMMIFSNAMASGFDQSDEAVLARDNTAFCFDLYRKLSKSPGNLFFSPYSISTAFAMTYAGARTNTEKQMAEALRFSLGQKNLHPAFAGMESKLNKVQEAGNIRLSVANSLWPQQDYKFLDEYLSLIKKQYGVSITPVDYKSACEAARVMINEWVEDKTNDKIQDLIPRGLLNAMTRLVLVNAIYFKGDWKSPFESELTKDEPFFVSSDKTVQAPLMTQKKEFRYAEFDTFQMLQLPYAGDELSMIVLLPNAIDGLKKLESDLSAKNLGQWKSRLNKREVIVFLPRFKMTSMFGLGETLASMGMEDAFNAQKADFSGMDGVRGTLYISAAIHKAFVEVNEEGTEAAAATGVVMMLTGMPAPPPTFRADHPFIFLIQDDQTDSVLFMGRVSDPTETSE